MPAMCTSPHPWQAEDMRREPFSVLRLVIVHW